MKLRIRHKLLAGFGVLLSLMLVVGLVSWWNVYTLKSDLDENQSHLDGTIALAKAESALWQLRYGFPQFMVMGPEEQAKIMAEDDQQYRMVSDGIGKYTNGHRSPEENQALKEFQEIFARYMEARPRWFQLQFEGKTQEAAEWRAQTTTPFGAASVRALARLIELSRESSNKHILDNKQRAETLELITIGLLVVAIPLGIFLSFLISQSITRPLTEAVRVANQVSVGNLSAEVVESPTDPTETGQLMRAMSNMTEYLKEMASVSDSMAAGNLWVEVKPRSADDRFGNSFRKMAISINRNLTEQKRAQEKLQAQTAKLEEQAQLLDLAHDTIMVRNSASEVIFWNRGAERTYGWSQEEALGKNTHELLQTKFPESLEKTQDAILKGGYWEGELAHTKHDGTQIIVSSRQVLQRDERGNVYRILEINHDISARKRMEKALLESEELYRQMGLNASDLLYVLHTDTNDLAWYGQIDSALGYEAGEFPRTMEAWEGSIHPEDHDRVFESFTRSCETGEPFGEEYRIRRKDGVYVYWSDLGRPLHADDGRMVRFIGACTDITARKQMEQELKQACEVAQQATRLKSEFLANMSHEIRTPMNGVIGMTGLLLDTPLSVEQREFTETIRSSADLLLTVINDILDFSKIEAGKLQFEVTDFDLRAAVEGTVELLAEQAQCKGIELASLVHADVPTALRGDPGRLRQVLANLASNAVKFTDHGEVVVQVTKQAEDDAHVIIRFEVSDTGVGISAEEQKQLFRAFTQADGSTTRKYGGTGLGLAISKQLVENMGGEIGVRSAPHEGSTFWCTARFEKQAAADDSAPLGGLPAKADLNGVRVLVVDDNETNRKIIHHQIISWGMRNGCVATGADALHVLRREAAAGDPYDLAILDMMMPEMDGLALARAIKSDPAVARTRLVMLTSLGQRGIRDEMREAGISACLNKPVKQSPLFDCLANVMAGEVVGFTARPAPLRPGSQNGRRQGRILVAEDNVVNQKVALRQLEKLGYSADAVANGQEVLSALASVPYDIVLMDCQMPDMDGYAATAEIRRREGSSRHTTVIAMTANAIEGDRERCLEAGMDDYISKPVKAEVLGATLERWQQSRIAAPETKGLSPSAANGPALAQEPAVDLKRLMDIFDGGSLDPEELIELYLLQTSGQVEELAAAIEAGAGAEVERLAHSCAGSSATCGVTALVAPLRELERMGQERHLADAPRLFSDVREQFERASLFLREYLKDSSSTRSAV